MCDMMNFRAFLKVVDHVLHTSGVQEGALQVPSATGHPTLSNHDRKICSEQRACRDGLSLPAIINISVLVLQTS